MSTQNLEAPLMRLLKFGTYDLNANRQGQLSFQQRQGLINGDDFTLIGLVVALPVFLVSWILGFSSVTYVLAIAAFLFVVGISSRNAVKKLLDIVTGTVKNAEGVITIYVNTTEQRTFLGALQNQWAYGVIEGVNFYVPAEMAQSFQGKKMRVYYTPRFRQAVSAEFIE